jgi:hypothetical protein
MTSITYKLINRIQRKKRGWVFTPKDFLDLGTRAAVDKVLSRLTKQAMIRRLDRGLYDYPKQHKLLGTLAPDPDSIARALAEGGQVYPSGAMAANLLGLSTQVPAKPNYLTNSPTRSRRVAGQTIKLTRARVALLDDVSHHANLMIQALSYFGNGNIDDQLINHCARALTDKDLAGLHHVMGRIPSWMADTIHKIEQIKHGQIHHSN